MVTSSIDTTTAVMIRTDVTISTNFASAGTSSAAAAATSGHLPVAVVGVVLLGACALAWSGRWNSWVHSWALYSVISVLPPLAVLLLTYGLIPVLPRGVITVLALLGFAALVAGSVVFLRQPLWFGPRWLHTEIQARRRGHPPPERHR